MKKLLALLMAVVMVLSFAACGTDKDDEKDGEPSSSVPEISDTVPADDAAANSDLADGAGNAPADNSGADTKLPVEAPEGADSLPADNADTAAPQPKN